MLGLLRRLPWGTVLVMMTAGTAYAQPEMAPHVVATYYHRTFRCQTCLHIESLARYDIVEVLASDIEDGQLWWRSLDFEKEENAHFKDQFELEGPSLVITLEDGAGVIKWVRLDRVWEIHDDVEVFDKYVLGTIEEYLTAAVEMGGDAKSLRPAQGHGN